MIWDRYQRSVYEAMNSHHYLKASNIIKEALHAAGTLKNAEAGMLRSADELADLHILNGDFQSAAALYRLSLTVQKNTYGSAHPDVERTQQALLRVLSQAGGITHISTAS